MSAAVTTVSADQDSPWVLSPHGRHPSGGSGGASLGALVDMGSLSGTFNVSPNTPSVLDRRSPTTTERRQKRAAKHRSAPSASGAKDGELSAEASGASVGSQPMLSASASLSGDQSHGRPRGHQNASEVVRAKHKARVRQSRDERAAAPEQPDVVKASTSPSPKPTDHGEVDADRTASTAKPAAVASSTRAYDKPWLTGASTHHATPSNCDVESQTNDGASSLRRRRQAPLTTTTRQAQPAKSAGRPQARGARQATTERGFGSQRSAATVASSAQARRVRRQDDTNTSQDANTSPARPRNSAVSHIMRPTASSLAKEDVPAAAHEAPRTRQSHRTAPATSVTTTNAAATTADGEPRPRKPPQCTRKDSLNSSVSRAAPGDGSPALHPTFVRVDSTGTYASAHSPVHVVQSVSTALYEGIYTELAVCEDKEVPPIFERPLSYYERQMVRRHAADVVAHYQTAMAKRKKALQRENALMPLTTYGGVAGGGVVEDLKHMSRVVRYSLEEENWRSALEVMQPFLLLCAKLLAPLYRAGEAAVAELATADTDRRGAEGEGGHAVNLVNSESEQSGWSGGSSVQFHVEDASAQPSLSGGPTTVGSTAPRASSPLDKQRRSEGATAVGDKNAERTPATSEARRPRRRGPLVLPTAPTSLCPIMQLVSFSRHEVGQELKRMVWWCAAHRLTRFSVAVGVAAGADTFTDDESSFAGPAMMTAETSMNTIPAPPMMAPSPVLNPAAHASHHQHHHGQLFSVFYDTVVLLLYTDKWLLGRVQLHSRSRVEGLITISLLPAVLQEARREDWARFGESGRQRLERFVAQGVHEAAADGPTRASVSRPQEGSFGGSYSAIVYDDEGERGTDVGSMMSRAASPSQGRHRELMSTSALSFFS